MENLTADVPGEQDHLTHTEGEVTRDHIRAELGRVRSVEAGF